MTEGPATLRPRFITRAVRERFELLRELAARGAGRDDVLAATGMTWKGLQTLLQRHGAGFVWPPAVFPEHVFDLPVRESGHHARTQAARAKVDHRREAARLGAEAALAFDDSALARRVARDQAALHAPRVAWLEAEAARYGLQRRGRLPEEMAA